MIIPFLFPRLLYLEKSLLHFTAAMTLHQFKYYRFDDWHHHRRRRRIRNPHAEKGILIAALFHIVTVDIVCFLFT